MKILLWKEWRENWKWAVLAFLGLLSAEMYALLQLAAAKDVESQQYSSICSPIFLLTTTCGHAVVGAALGFLLIQPELYRDRWAMLVHRPVTRDEIFWAKMLSGLSLYAAATLPSLLICFVWAATPGHLIGIFSPSMMIPSVVDWVVGIFYLFGASLTSLIRGPRSLVKAAPILICLFCSILAGTSSIFSSNLRGLYQYATYLDYSGRYFERASEFPTSVWILIGVLFAMLLLAAWGAFRSSGEYRSQSWTSRSATFALVAIAIWTLGSQVTFPAREVGHRTVRSTANYWQVQPLDDGRIIKAHTMGTRVVVMDDQDRVLQDLRDVGYGNFFGDKNRTATQLFSLEQHRYPVGYRDIEHSSTLVFQPSRETIKKPYVFFSVERKTLTLIDPQTRKSIGTLGPDGIRPPEAAPYVFGSSNLYSFQRLLICDEGIFAYDQDRLALHFLVGPEVRRRARGLAILKPETWSWSHPEAQVVIAEPETVHFFGPSGAKIADLALPHPLTPGQQLSVSSDGQRIFVETPETYDSKTSKPIAGFMEEYDSQGQLLKHVVIPLVDPVPYVEEVQEWSFLDALGQELNPGEWLDGVVFGILNLRNLMGAENGLLKILVYTSGMLLVLGLMKLLDGPPLLQRGWGWAILFVCFGLTTFLILYLLEGWPRREKCPVCGHRRLVDHNHCDFCHSEWSPAPLTGHEIFDHDEASLRTEGVL